MLQHCPIVRSTLAADWSSVLKRMQDEHAYAGPRVLNGDSVCDGPRVLGILSEAIPLSVSWSMVSTAYRCQRLLQVTCRMAPSKPNRCQAVLGCTWISSCDSRFASSFSLAAASSLSFHSKRGHHLYGCMGDSHAIVSHPGSGGLLNNVLQVFGQCLFRSRCSDFHCRAQLSRPE